jgi:hypothetical protein
MTMIAGYEWESDSACQGKRIEITLLKSARDSRDPIRPVCVGL